MNFLLVKPHLPLKVAQTLHGLLHLEPLELEIVAGGIGREHDVRIMDLSLNKKPERDFLSEIRDFKPDVIGFTGYSNQAKNILKLAKIAKDLYPKIVNIVGGVHVTIEPQYFENQSCLDLLVRGEGAILMAKIIDSIENNKPFPESDALIPIKSANFATLANTPPPLLPDYDKIPLPRRELIDPKKYFCIWAGEKGERMKTLFPDVATVRTSTGCPHRCNFCVVHYLANGKYMQRTPEDVVDEIEALDQDYIYFVDDEMFINAKRVKVIADLLKERGVKKRYISWARSDTICANRELFKQWKEIGLSTLYVGMESMEKEALEGFNKGYEPDTNRKAVNILKELDICLHAAFMVRPEFEEKDFINLRKTVESIGVAEVTFTVFSPPPGTALWSEHKDNFIVDDPYYFYDCMHTIMPLTLPMNKFYRYFSLLSLFALRNNPWRRRKIKAPLKDMFRMAIAGFKYGHALRNIYKDYPVR